MVVLLSLAACTDDTEYTAGVWYRRSDFDGVARTDAAGFTIGNVGYLCTGYRGSTKDRLKDCWAYDIEANSWTQCTSMPDAAPARNAATGFAVGTKGYIATGYDATKKDYLNDCWQYDPATNSWKEMASIPDGTDGTNIYGKRYYALSFGIGQYGYLGTGYNDNYQKDFWKFDPSVGDKGEWTAMSYWIYDPLTDLWDGEDLTDFEGSTRSKAVCFSTGKRGIIATGGASTYYYDDTWELKPYEYEEK